jgi:malic enzyme
MTGLIATVAVVIGVTVMANKGYGVVAVGVVIAGAAGFGIAAWARAFAARARASSDVAAVADRQGAQYRQLTDEYRRFADMAITAQEHADLKLGDVSARIDYLRDQMESLQKILKEVE